LGAERTLKGLKIASWFLEEEKNGIIYFVLRLSQLLEIAWKVRLL